MRRSGGEWMRAIGWAAVAGALVLAAGALLPLRPAFVSSVLDDSFGLTLHFEAATRAATGTRLISSYGPLGFLFYDVYLPATYAWLFGLQLGLAAILCWTVGWIGWAAQRSPWGAALALAVCTPYLASPDVRSLAVPLLALLVELLPDRTPPVALRIALGVALGLIALIKLTYLIAALVVVVALTITALVRRRRLALLPVVAIAAAASAWVAVGLGWADWIAFLDWSLRDITLGYSSAMQLPTTGSLLVHVASVAAALLAAATVLVWRRVGRAGAVLLLALAAELFLIFKAGFVRADVHVFITSFAFMVLAVLLALIAGRTPRQLVIAAALVLALPGALLWHAVAVNGPPSTVFHAIGPIEALRRLGALPDLAGRLSREHAQRVAAIRAEVPLPALRGGVDIYPYDQGVLIAHDVEFRPRPVFQSYMAYTPRLARANADALLGARAPEWILFRPGSIDWRLPANDDAPSWPLLLTRYRLVDRAGPFALLQRRAVPRGWRLTPLVTLRTTTNTPVAVPPVQGGPIWVLLDVPLTTGERLLTTLLAAPVLYVDILLSNGHGRAVTVVQSLARDGFLLSPVIDDRDQFERLMQGELGGLPTVKALTLRIAEPLGGGAEARPVEVQFLRLELTE